MSVIETLLRNIQKLRDKVQTLDELFNWECCTHNDKKLEEELTVLDSKITETLEELSVKIKETDDDLNSIIRRIEKLERN